jgi:hypothetical protein
MAIDLAKYVGLKPQDIFNNLYLLPNKVQFCHHLTTSYAQHKALDKAYNTLEDLKDEIVEQLIGYGVPKFLKLDLGSISGFTDAMPKEVAKEVMKFGKDLEQYAEANNYCNIANKAQEWSGAGAQLNYLLGLH